ncbi:outer membrane beta-barrel protein [Pontibacter mangrovi]|uniref:Porin family protein n=1 Tax=Pontibacter mangrovi TaxID=2589816 RepID=A0A501WFH5_9BACT|nr:outer membrane beta-barrel protein [Pontibacter mangrovi]TPE45931.1 porin family protein [Pontibacter mangrovi]
MKQTFTLVTILFLLPFSLLAQADFRKAQVVQSNGDTLRGLVNLREWNINPNSFTFKSTASSSESTLTPANTVYLNIDGIDIYKRYVGPVSMNYMEMSRLAVGPDMNVQPDSVFLRQLHKGNNAALYLYTDHVKSRFFLENLKSGEIQELYFSKYLPATGEMHVKYVHQYRGQLWGLANALGRTSAGLKKKIENADYSNNNLMEIVLLLNKTEEAASKAEKERRKQSNLYAGLGINISAAKVREDNPLVTEKERSNSVGPLVTLGYLTYFNKFTKRLAVRWELAYADVKHDASATIRARGLVSYRVNTYVQRYHNLRFSPQLQYSFYVSDKWRLFANGGFSINYALNATNQLISEHHYYNDNLEEMVFRGSSTNMRYNNVWFGVPVRLGILLADKYELVLGYNMGLKPGVIDQVKANSLQFGVNYHFIR